MSRIINVGVWIVFFFCATAFSQEAMADSLQNVLKNSKDDIEKAKVLNQLASAYQDFDPKQMQVHAQKALELSQKINFASAEGTALLNLGNVGIIAGNFYYISVSTSNGKQTQKIIRK